MKKLQYLLIFVIGLGYAGVAQSSYIDYGDQAFEDQDYDIAAQFYEGH